MKKLVFILALFLCFKVYPCSCVGVTSFCYTANQTGNHVFAGKVVKTEVSHIDLEIIEKLRGVELRDTIRIWDDTIIGTVPSTCNDRVHASNIGNVGDRIIISLNLVDSATAATNPWAIEGDYLAPLNTCTSRPYLRVLNDSLKLQVDTFRIDPPFTSKTVAYTDFIDHWKRNGGSCSGLLASLDDNRLKKDKIIISPNPTYGRINIPRIQGLESIRLYNLEGKVIKELRVSGNTASRLQIDGPKGVYLLQLRKADGSLSAIKVLKR